jgi:hypothetical protein
MKRRPVTTRLAILAVCVMSGGYLLLRRASPGRLTTGAPLAAAAPLGRVSLTSLRAAFDRPPRGLRAIVFFSTS